MNWIAENHNSVPKYKHKAGNTVLDNIGVDMVLYYVVIYTVPGENLNKLLVNDGTS